MPPGNIVRASIVGLFLSFPTFSIPVSNLFIPFPIFSYLFLSFHTFSIPFHIFYYIFMYFLKLSLPFLTFSCNFRGGLGFLSNGFLSNGPSQYLPNTSFLKLVPTPTFFFLTFSNLLFLTFSDLHYCHFYFFLLSPTPFSHLHFFALLLRFVLFILPALFVLYFSVEFRLVFL